MKNIKIDIKMRIEEITLYHPDMLVAINKFLNLLVENEFLITKQVVEAIISDTNSHLFFAIDGEGVYLGMLTVGFYYAPTGKKAWIEDVVVDEKYRGQGVGKELTNFAIQFVKDQLADVLMLTSNPARKEANNLYKKIGFQQKVTNVYRIVLK